LPIDASDLKEMVDMIKDNKSDNEIRKFYEKAIDGLNIDIKEFKK
jgi:hypothetical protein